MLCYISSSTSSSTNYYLNNILKVIAFLNLKPGYLGKYGVSRDSVLVLIYFQFLLKNLNKKGLSLH